MPRIRTIKPDAFLSESLSTVPRGARWTFAGLWTYADDKGRARDDVRLIKAALYPLDDSISLKDVSHDLDLLWNIGAICRYVVDGRNYLHMPKWGHQKINRPTPAKSPPCPVHEGGESGHVVHSDDSLTTHGAISEPSGGEKEGKGREGNISCASADAADATDNRFEEFWDTYDKKRGRKAAEAKYRLALKKRGITPDLLITAAASYIAWQKQEGKHPEFTKDPATWLNGEHWTDEKPGRPQAAPSRLPHASQLETPPDGLTEQEYAEWLYGRRA